LYFTVIIPLYNKEKHIKRAIQSVLTQTYQKFELIIVDDGSTDSGVKIVREIHDERLKVIQKENEGVSSARNKGIENATYDYIAFLDADDSWYSNFLLSIYEMIQSYPKAGAYCTAYEFIKEDEIKNASFNVEIKQGTYEVVDYFRGALKNPLISASSVVINKNAFNELGLFSEELTRGEDLEMWCRIALNYKVVFLNQILAKYYLNAENRSNRKLTFTMTFMSRAEEILENEQRKGNKSLYFEEYMISRIMPKVRYLINYNNLKEARVILKKYKHTKYSKKAWLKNYFLTFRIINGLKRMLKSKKF